jgi:hypothetical protein
MLVPFVFLGGTHITAGKLAAGAKGMDVRKVASRAFL